MARFWEGLGRVWEGLARDLGAFGSFWARIWKPSWTLLGGFFGNPGALLVVSEASLGSLGYFGYVLGYVVVPGKVYFRALESIWEGFFLGICGALLDTSGASLGSLGSPRQFLGYDVIPGKI